MTNTRKIPTVMFSQHPDHANKPDWHHQAFIKTHHETKECYLMFKEFGAQEMMWDWEGKFVDEAVVEKLLGSYQEFFKKKPLGKEVFLTFRVPNPRVESGYRLGRAFMVILSAQHLAYTLKLSHNPLFEIILPMAENAKDIVHLQKSWQRISKAAGDSFGSQGTTKKIIEVIPIFESVETILKSGKIIREYTKLVKHELGFKPSYLRPFCARSDPALNSGIVPTTLAIKWALSEYAKFTQEEEIATYPIIAPGALPFRGGLKPQTIEEFMTEFPGIRTLVIQSAFRYDYPYKEVKTAIKQLSQKIPMSQTKLLPKDFFEEIMTVIPWFEIPYRKTVEKMVPVIREIAKHIPARRERMQHIGLFGYSRQVGKVRLPRAIGFCASCYSLGIPPELIGTGMGLKMAQKEGKLKVIESLYRGLKPSLLRAGKYLRKESVKELGLKEVEEEIKIIEEYVGEELGPKTTSELQHSEIAANIISALNKGEDVKTKIEQAALLRHSLG